MAKIDVPRLNIRKSRTGRGILCYWTPSATLQKAGWKPTPLGTDLDLAIAKAKKLNAQVDEWRDGGARPHRVKAYVKHGTMAQLWQRFKAARYIDPRMGGLAMSTRDTYNSAWNIIERWAGSEQVAHITRARVRKFRDALLKPDKSGTVHLSRANGAMRLLHTVMAFAINEGWLPDDAPNPAAKHNMPGTPARDQVWSALAIELFCRAAREDVFDQPSLELAIHLGREVTQREADIIGLTRSKWVKIEPYRLGQEIWDRLAEPEPDGERTVRGIRVRQGKTKRWIEVPVVGELRRMMTEAVAQADARVAALSADSTVSAEAVRAASLLIQELAIPTRYRNASQFERALVTELSAAGKPVTPEGLQRLHAARRERRPWTETRFQRAVSAFRDKAATLALKDGDDVLAEEIRDLEFRDMRRTGVVWLGELGIEPQQISALTGHKLQDVLDILEVYMPRTTKMAGLAVVQRIERDPAGTVKIWRPNRDSAG